MIKEKLKPLSEHMTIEDINEIEIKLKKLKEHKLKEKEKESKKKKLVPPKFKGTKKIKESEILEHEEEKIVLQKTPFYKVKKWNTTGYILYELTKNSKNFNLVAINNFKDVFKSKWGKAYIKHDMLGNMNGKPLLIIKNHIPLSLKIKPVKSTFEVIENDKKKKEFENKKVYNDGYELCYDPQTFYNTFEYLTFANLKIRDSTESGFGEFLRKNWWKLLLIAIVVGFFLLTDQGKQILSKLGDEMIFKHYK